MKSIKGKNLPELLALQNIKKPYIPI